MKFFSLVLRNRVSYLKGLELQKHFQNKLKENSSIGGYLLLLEHDPVYTVGKRLEITKEDEQLFNKLKVDYCKIDRGGQWTYHGPGQLVGYPIMHLKRLNTSTRCFIDGMEKCLQKTLLDQYNLETHPYPPHTGIFTRNQKIGSIGVHVGHYITKHGFSLNIQAECLFYFDQIRACGLDMKMTSLETLLEKKISLHDPIPSLMDNFSDHFKIELTPLEDYHIDFLDNKSN